MRVSILMLMLMACPAVGEELSQPLVEAAIERTRHAVRYDGQYRVIPYPNGDVPAEVGVCTDVVIRAYRTLGIDLQQRVHEDMSAAFSAIPQPGSGA